MRNLIKIMLLACATLAPASTAQAVFLFRAILTTDQETPITPPAQNPLTGGVANFVLNDARTRLTYDVQLFGLDMRGVNPLTALTTFGDVFAPSPGPQAPIPGDSNNLDNFIRLHIHSAVAGVAGGIVFGMIESTAVVNPGNTINDINPNDLVIDTLNLHITGAWDLTEGAGNTGAGPNILANQLGNLFAGGLYLNVHTSDFRGGEIRGQILAVPEPGSLALLALGAVGLVVPALRRRQLRGAKLPTT